MVTKWLTISLKNRFQMIPGKWTDRSLWEYDSGGFREGVEALHHQPEITAFLPQVLHIIGGHGLLETVLFAHQYPPTSGLRRDGNAILRKQIGFLWQLHQAVLDKPWRSGNVLKQLSVSSPPRNCHTKQRPGGRPCLGQGCAASAWWVCVYLFPTRWTLWPLLVPGWRTFPLENAVRNVRSLSKSILPFPSRVVNPS